MVLKSGAHLGPYEIMAPLGAGGMGEWVAAVSVFLTAGFGRLHKPTTQSMQ